MSETRTVTSVQARKSLLKAFKKQRPLFLWGPPGIGKSELVADITEELGGIIDRPSPGSNGAHRYSWYSVL